MPLQTPNCEMKRGRAGIHACGKRNSSNSPFLAPQAGVPTRASRGGVEAHAQAQRNTKSRAGPPRESPAGFRIASPLHNKKETPGEAPGVGSPLLTRRGIWQALVRNTPVPQGTKDNSPVRFRGRACALRNKCRVSKTNAPSLCRRPAAEPKAERARKDQRSGAARKDQRSWNALKPIPRPAINKPA